MDLVIYQALGTQEAVKDIKSVLTDNSNTENWQHERGDR